MLLEEVPSKYSGKLQVLKTFPWSQPYISTGYLTQSGGLVHDVWKPVIKTIKNYQKYLILGLAGGTLAKLIINKNPQARITGVEIDPAMIYLGKKYLGLDKIPNLKIIIGDAQKNLPKSDVIFVDMYLNDQIPDFVYTKSFLTKLAKSARLVVFNHLFYDQHKKDRTEKLIKTLESMGFEIKLHRVLTNVLITATPNIRRKNHIPPRQTVF